MLWRGICMAVCPSYAEHGANVRERAAAVFRSGRPNDWFWSSTGKWLHRLRVSDRLAGASTSTPISMS